MHLWLSRSSEVPLREQLITQITLGVVSGDLKAGRKLPSTREVARRFRIHSNTVSAAYRELYRRGWVEFRKGSGVYVSELTTATKLDGLLKLDQLVAQFLKSARDSGFSLSDIRSRIGHWLNLQPPDHILVIEPDRELRRILMAEIEAATGWPVQGASVEECRDSRMLIGASPVAMYSQAKSVSVVLPPGVECLLVHSTSVAESLKEEKPPQSDALVAVASRWPEFLKTSRAILVAAGLNPDVLDFRDARTRGWQRGLGTCAFVIADVLTAKVLPTNCRARVFRVISDASLGELRKAVAVLMENGSAR